MIEIAVAFILGLTIGSFLNVCIGRIPQDQSIISPPSHCPHCGTPIAPYDNIPLLSYLILRGRCRSCGVGISFRYPAVEALTGVLFAIVVATLGVTAWTAVALLFVAALVVVTFIDIDHQIIPDEISLPGIVLGFIAAATFGPGVLDSLLGILLGGGTLWAVAAGYEWLRGQEGMGGGDIKLLAMIGAFLGWRAVLVTLLIGSLTGALVGGARVVFGRAESQVPIPFGPFLACGAFAALLWGEQLVDWYLGLAS
jgi:leader peptidase (prepilin peptidase)/N-methyltransferase